MRTGNVLFSAVHFFVCVILLALGGSLVAVAKIDHLKILISSVVFEKASTLANAGYLVLAGAGILFFCLSLMHRGRSYSFKMKNNKVSMGKSLIQNYVEAYWKTLFPDTKLIPEVLIYHRNKIEVFAQLPDLKEEEQTQLLEKIENELGELFAEKLGYEKDFQLTISER